MKGDAREVRRRIRVGQHTGHTAGLAPGVLQVNLVILPEPAANDFAGYCDANTQACPLISMTLPGQTDWPALGVDIDLLHDVPAYNVYRAGYLEAAHTNLADQWRDDLVSFALGCSFTFEHALRRAGIPVRNIERNTTVPMFKTNIPTVSCGPFGGPLVVSMRPIPKDRIKQVEEICAHYPWAHGAPVHAGDPLDIGFCDVDSPDWGDPSEIQNGELPVFWACGVTPQAALMQARLPFCITHRPGHMLVTDLPEDDPSLADMLR